VFQSCCIPRPFQPPYPLMPLMITNLYIHS
jgi:hypothetical protein